jgi:hypothetical protein
MKEAYEAEEAEKLKQQIAAEEEVQQRKESPPKEVCHNFT